MLTRVPETLRFLTEVSYFSMYVTRSFHLIGDDRTYSEEDACAFPLLFTSSCLCRRGLVAYDTCEAVKVVQNWLLTEFESLGKLQSASCAS